jgi:hypothetical protein
LKPASTDNPPPAQKAPATETSADGRSTSFRAVEGGSEMQSGEMLLVEAYAAIWTLLFVMLLLWWRRQRHIDSRITLLEQAVASARAEGAKGRTEGAASGASVPLAVDKEEAADA